MITTRWSGHEPTHERARAGQEATIMGDRAVEMETGESLWS
jgi:hypothetical protein